MDGILKQLLLIYSRIFRESYIIHELFRVYNSSNDNKLFRKGIIDVTCETSKEQEYSGIKS